MKKILFSAMALIMASASFAKCYYCDPAATNERAKATSWDDAMAVKALRTSLAGVKAGDTIYVKGGTIQLGAASEYWKINQSITLIGGFDPTATGKVTSLPKYPSATPTILNGDVNKDGKPSQGDAATLMRIDLSANTSSKVYIQGFTLINTYYSDPSESTKDIDSYLNECSAIRVICGTAFIKNCEMYNHIMPANRGSQCITAVGANVHLIDCDLHHCQCVSRGALVRGRQYFIGGNEDKPVAPSIVIERCALHDASCMGGSKENVDGVYGGAVHMSAGELFAINSTFINDSTFSKGGAIRTISGVTAISCTFAQNYSARAYSTDAKPNTYGSSFGLNSEKNITCKFQLMNNFIVDDKDDGTKKYAAFYTDDNTYDMEDIATSGGYNILGTMYVICNGQYVADQSNVWLATDRTSTSSSINKFTDFFGSLDNFQDNGGCSKSIFPLLMQDGPSVAELQSFANDYCPQWTKVNAACDQRGYARDVNVTCVGAAALDATEPYVAVENVTSDIRFNGQLFNVLGQPVDANYHGIVIQNGHKYIR